MSWFFDVSLPADPAACHDAAATLRTAAEAAQDAADFLDGQVALPRADFSGLAAQSYRSAAATLGADSRGVGGDLHGLAAALDDYAARVGAARRTLQRVREEAVAAGFRLTVDDLVQWVPAGGTPSAMLYERLESQASQAHSDAEAARVAWWSAVQALTTGPLAGPGVEVPSDPPPGPPSGSFERVDQDVSDPPAPAPPSAAPADADLPSYAPQRERDRAPVPDDAAGPGLGTLHWAPLPLHWSPFPAPPAPMPCLTAAEGVLT